MPASNAISLGAEKEQADKMRYTIEEMSKYAMSRNIVAEETQTRRRAMAGLSAFLPFSPE